MESRQHIRLSTLHRRANTSATENDWVTIGVIVSKSEPRMSAKVVPQTDVVSSCAKSILFFTFYIIVNSSFSLCSWLLKESNLQSYWNFYLKDNYICVFYDHKCLKQTFVLDNKITQWRIIIVVFFTIRNVCTFTKGRIGWSFLVLSLKCINKEWRDL